MRCKEKKHRISLTFQRLQYDLLYAVKCCLLNILIIPQYEIILIGRRVSSLSFRKEMRRVMVGNREQNWGMNLILSRLSRLVKRCCLDFWKLLFIHLRKKKTGEDCLKAKLCGNWYSHWSWFLIYLQFWGIYASKLWHLLNLDQYRCGICLILQCLHTLIWVRLGCKALQSCSLSC